MHRRTLAIFWTAVAVAVLLLGGGVATAQRILDQGGSIGDDLVLSLILVGLVAAVLVASRIVLAIGRAQRPTRVREARDLRPHGGRPAGGRWAAPKRDERP